MNAELLLNGKTAKGKRFGLKYKIQVIHAFVSDPTK